MERGIQQMKNATTIATGLFFKLDQDDGVKYRQDDKRDVDEQDSK